MLKIATLLNPNRSWSLAAGAVLAAAALTGCGSGGITQTPPPPAAHGRTQNVSGANVGHLGPLTVSNGQLQCE